MLVGIHSHYPVFNIKNAIFNKESYQIGEDMEYQAVLLKERMEKLGHELATLDLHPLEEYGKVIFCDIPNRNDMGILRKLFRMNIDLHLVIFESEIVLPQNWKILNHRYFRKIFCWNEDWVDNKKYFLAKNGFRIPTNLDWADAHHSRKLCTMIACNKTIHDKRELYSERKNVIRWFEHNHPEDFDLYGIGWDRRTFKRPLSIFNRIATLRKIFYRRFPSYRGCIDSKRDTLRNYKFSICYENAQGLQGYITEKIFDSFFAGCIPIYWGAPNVAEYVPTNAFINRLDFDSNEKLYEYIKKMEDDIYRQYLRNIQQFIYGDKIDLFSAECFSETIINGIFT